MFGGMISALQTLFTELSMFHAGLLASLFAGLAAGVGALPVFALRDISQRVQDVMIGFAAGVMMAASAFSLLLPSIEAGTERWGDEAVASLAAALGAMIGAALLWSIHRYAPHEHFAKGREGVPTAQIRRIWLFVIAITLHNFPEGLAVGVSFGGGDVANGLAVTLGMFLQNLPEGLVVALALLALDYTPAQSVLAALATGAVETVGGFVGAGAVALSSALLPWALAGAGGAMLFVISHEIIPESHRNGHETPATFGLMAGFVVMMVLDVTLG